MRGLVLAGGGAKGSYQIGVWKALKELDIEFDVVCGTSIGAFNGAFVAQNQFDKAYKLWSHMTMSDLFEADENLLEAFDAFMKEKKIPMSLTLYMDFFHYLKSSGGLDITPLREIIDKYLDEDLIRNSNVDYGLVTMNIDKLKPLRLFVKDIPKGELKHYLLGSAMVPGFAREKTSPFKFVDGGVFDNFPVKMAVERGCDEIVAVSLSNIRRKKWGDTKITYIEPREDLGNFLHVDHDRIHKNMRMGYLDTLKAYGHLEGNEFYFKNLLSEHDIIKKLSLLDYELKNKICQLVLEKDLIHERFFFEKVMYKIARMLDVDSKSGYKQLFLNAYEALLLSSGENHLEVYSPVIVKHRLKGKVFEDELLIYKLLLEI